MRPSVFSDIYSFFFFFFWRELVNTLCPCFSFALPLESLRTFINTETFSVSLAADVSASSTFAFEPVCGALAAQKYLKLCEIRLSVCFGFMIVCDV